MKSNFFSRRRDPSSGESSPGAPPLRPSPPLAKRLNRNALTVAAVIMGMTVLTAVVVLNPGEEQEKSGTERPNVDEEPPVPSRPTFLDEPVWVIPVLPDTAAAPELAPSEEETDAPPSQTSSAAVGSLANRAYDHATVDIGSHDAYASSASRQTSPYRSARQQAFEAALTSSALLEATAESRSVSQSEISSLATEEEQLLSLGDSILRAAARQAAVVASPVTNESPSGSSSAASMSDTEHGARAFLERAGDVVGTTVIAQLEPAGSPYTLRAGTVIPGSLITGINSDLPGEIVGQVSRDVYDSRTQRGVPQVKVITREDGKREEQPVVRYTGLRLHDLRHVTGQVATDEGATTAQVGDALGHSDYKTTARYQRRRHARVVGQKVSSALFQPRSSTAVQKGDRLIP